jgi:hypothetical protein
VPVSAQKIRPSSLQYSATSKHAGFRTRVEAVATAVDNMPFDGKARLLSATEIEDTGSSFLEFAAIAVRKYKYQGEYLCDYVIATKDYTKTVDIVGKSEDTHFDVTLLNVKVLSWSISLSS